MKIAEMEQRIAEWCRDHHSSGVLRVTSKDQIQYEGSFGYANWEKKTPFDENSMFTFYSLSKPFCALGFLKLKDRGLVDLDVHPSKYVPEMAGFDSRVTFRQLLHHTSGLPDFGQTPDFKAKYGRGYRSVLREHMKRMAEYPMLFAPGTQGFYANINFCAQALAIENITGMTYEDYMKQEVFTPLGMHTAVVDNETLYIPNRVQGYALADGILTPVEKSHDWMLGGGDIVGRVDDVYCLNKAIKNRLLVSEETWDEILTPSPLNKKGMGCTITTWHGKRRITHNGGHVGFRTIHIQLPEDDFDIICLSNSGFGDMRKFIAEAVYDTFYESSSGKSEEVEMDKGYI